MSDKLLIKNGKVALSGENHLRNLDIETQNGVITALGSNLSGDNVIDAGGCVVIPGGIDPHVHFDDPGFTEREDFLHGSSAAASGGITTVIDMPCTSVPPVTNLENLKEKHNHIEKKALVDYGFFGGVSAQSYEEGFAEKMEELSNVVLGFKTYFLSGMDSFKRLSSYQFMRVLQKAKEFNIPVLLHAEDAGFVEEATRVEQAKGSDWENYYRSRPEIAEILAVQDAISMARHTGAELHIVHVATARAAELIKDIENVTGETCPHYLAFSKEDFEKYGSALKTAPVVKSEENKSELWGFLREGGIDFMASDHAPAPEEQKNTGSVWTDYSGIPGNPTLLPYLFSEGYAQKRLNLSRFLELISENAARRYGFYDRKGSITIGKDADLVIIEPDTKWMVRGKDLYSKGKITPFEGMEWEGRIRNTILRGQVIYDADRGITAEPGYGKLIKRKG
ncbi:MAG: allantoinase AllB [Bacteroidales bacterium]|nr:allantoinase AllB [Bacteroidales bacterium]